MELLAALAIAAAFLLLRKRRRRWTPRRRRRARALPPAIGSVVAGKAYVTDGDGLRVSGCTVRFAALDAPEWDQWAKHRDGYWFKHGKRVKSALIETIGGRHVRVTVEGYDKYDRTIGTVTCDGKDVGAWLVRNGHAIAAYSERYKDVEREARQERRGLWGHDVAFDPRYWRAETGGERIGKQ